MLGAAIHFALNLVNISITHSVFHNNFAKVHGGGILIEENVRRMYIAACNFTDNFVWGYGAAAYFGA